MRMESSVVVARTIDEVWAFATELFNAPRWSTGFLGVRQTSPGPLGLGSTVQARVVIFGVEMRLSGAVTEWDPPRAGTLSLTGAGVRSLALRVILEPTAGGTRFMRVTNLEPRPAFRPLWWIASVVSRRRARATDQRLKRLLEAGRSERRGSTDAR